MLSADVSEIEEQSNDSLSENDEEPSMDDEKTSAEAAREEFAEEKEFLLGKMKGILHPILMVSMISFSISKSSIGIL